MRLPYERRVNEDYFPPQIHVFEGGRLLKLRGVWDSPPTWNHLGDIFSLNAHVGLLYTSFPLFFQGLFGILLLEFDWHFCRPSSMVEQRFCKP